MPSLTNGRMMCRVCSAAGVLGIARRRPANSCACAGSLKRSTDARTCYVALSLLRHTVSGSVAPPRPSPSNVWCFMHPSQA